MNLEFRDYIFVTAISRNLSLSIIVVSLLSQSVCSLQCGSKVSQCYLVLVIQLQVYSSLSEVCVVCIIQSYLVPFIYSINISSCGLQGSDYELADFVSKFFGKLCRNLMRQVTIIYFVYHAYVGADLGRIFYEVGTVPIDELILNLIFCLNMPRQACPSDHVMAEQVCTLWYCANSLISGPLSSKCYPFCFC